MSDVELWEVTQWGAILSIDVLQPGAVTFEDADTTLEAMAGSLSGVQAIRCMCFSAEQRVLLERRHGGCSAKGRKGGLQRVCEEFSALRVCGER